jgi:hypothetical protein
VITAIHGYEPRAGNAPGQSPTLFKWHARILPRNAKDKILKRELRDPYWEGQEWHIG